MLADCLRDVLELWRLTKVFRCLNKRVHERHSLEYVVELCRSFALVHVNKVRQKHTFGKNAPNFIEDFVPFLLNLRVPLHYAAVNKTHADGTNFVNQGLRD